MQGFSIAQKINFFKLEENVYKSNKSLCFLRYTIYSKATVKKEERQNNKASWGTGSRLRAREMEPNLALSDISLQKASNKNASSNQVKVAHFQWLS